MVGTIEDYKILVEVSALLQKLPDRNKENFLAFLDGVNLALQFKNANED